MDVFSKYHLWLDKAKDDLDLIEELKSISINEEEIHERFYRNLEFGTGGLRGLIGVGTNRMNIYTVRKATQGLANYLLRIERPSVAIAHDSRIKSELFAKAAASVLAVNGIKVYIYSQIMPTPALSFAVRNLKCDAGICITASHNPAKYNGYKVYGSDGCQITLDNMNTISEQITMIDEFEDVLNISFKDGMKANKIDYITNDVIDSFINSIKLESVDSIHENLKIVYTPLNGVGKMCVLRILNEMGFHNVNVVPEQEYPDGSFSTCPYPNPEKKEALQKGLELCEKLHADLLLATDPDCDRVGIAVKTKEDTYKLLSGNEVGILLLDYIIKMRIANETMPKNPIVVKTIVTTDMVNEIAKEYGIEVINTLTGFKFIGEQIGILEKKEEINRYIFGFEESYGYLSGGYVRDKDAVGACMLICEMVSSYKKQGITLVDKMHELYNKYGFYQNRLLEFTFESAKGIERMECIMKNFRSNAPAIIGENQVIAMSDYLMSTRIEAGVPMNIRLPKSNILEYNLDNKSKIIIRPSGTEPKIKVYISSCADSLSKCVNNIDVLEKVILEKF